jgi:hypothetical protein
MKRNEPCPEEEMKKKVRVNTICSILRRIYRKTNDEEIKLMARVATTMAKKMGRKLSKYKKRWDKDFWDAN